jgi:peptidyl-prolyl cis-trans isomerase C
MTQFTRWIWIGAVLALGVGCGKQESQVVKPQALQDAEVSVWVDQAGITGGQIRQEVSRLFSRVPQNLPPEQLQIAQMNALRQAVDNLVTRQLVKAEMERSGVLISQEEIEQGKQQLEKGLGEGRSLAMLIAEANLPMEELEYNLRLDLFKNKVLKDKLEAALAGINADTAKTYYDEHPQEFTEPEGRRAVHILVRVPEGADDKTRADLRAKADGIHKSLAEGAEFAKLASEVSDCPSRIRGGAVGVIPRGREAPAFEEAVYGTPIGQISGVVESPVGFHVVMPTSEQQAKVYSYDEVKDKLLALLRSKEQQRIAAEYIAELRGKAVIKLDGALAETVDKAKQAAAAEPAGQPPEAAPVTAPAPTPDPAPAAPVPAP